MARKSINFLKIRQSGLDGCRKSQYYVKRNRNIYALCPQLGGYSDIERLREDLSWQ